MGFILQNADDRCSRPLAILFVGIAVFGIGKTIVFLISRGERMPISFSTVAIRRALVPVQAHTKSGLGQRGKRYGSGIKQVFVFLRFHIAVNGKGSNKISVTALYIQRGTGLDRNIPAIGLR